jgi:hypothetical protein
MDVILTVAKPVMKDIANIKPGKAALRMTCLFKLPPFMYAIKTIMGKPKSIR